MIENTFVYKKVEEILFSVIDDRESFYDDNDAPKAEDVPKIISNSANKCAAISGAAGLVPGAWGMAASVPEIVALIRTQMHMVYDVGVAHGKKDILTPEIVLQILISSVGTSAISVASINTARHLVKESSITTIRSLAKKYGVSLSGRIAKTMVSKWVPVIGAAALARWSRYSTKNIGEKADEVFSDPKLLTKQKQLESPE